MTKDQDNSLEKLLTASLSRAIDWLKFAEAKNAALLTFSSAWIVGLFNYVNSSISPILKVCAIWGIPFFVLAALLAVVSFIPRTILGKFYSRKTGAGREKNLLFFGDLKDVPLEEASTCLRDRYSPDVERALADKYVDDISVQLVVISRIAYHKFSLFDWGAAAVITAFIVMMVVVPVISFIQMLMSAANGS